MIRLLATIAALLGAALSGPAFAQSLILVSVPVVFVQSPSVQQLQRADRNANRPVAEPIAKLAESGLPAVPGWTSALDRSPRNYALAIAQYGPFIVIDERRAALIAETDAHTPAAFRSMVRDFPRLAQLDMVECPGTQDDRANMKVGRMIRAARLVTHVPASGSVRSGAVELFLAGVQRDISDGAEFAVHSWMDEYGREAEDFSDDAPENRQYVDYYREMGLPAAQARAFYAMTNSVPHERALWLGADDMRRWLGSRDQAGAGQRASMRRNPRIEYASLTRS